MATSMSWKQVELDGQPRILLEGTISESTDFRTLAELPSDTLSLDLANVEQINSCGVREWINFVNVLKASGKRVELHRCSPAIVRQLNMISNFKGDGKVRSVLAPYYCENCDHEMTVVLDVTDPDTPPEIAETITCPECGEEMEFDDLPDSYLEFLEQ